MANTLKFGNGNWAIKEGSTLAYNDENNNFKPLPFDFTRDSTATYVDSDGLIKTAGDNVPRIDYTDSTDGALLLEPARTNLLPYSEDFNQWLIFGTLTIDDDYGISPSGKQDSTKLTFSSDDVSLYTSIDTSGTYTSTVYVKGVSGETIRLGLGNDSVADGTLFTLNGDWQRFENTNTDTLTGYPTINTYGATALELEVWGYQLEEASYATSYIPTQGSTVTRLADVCSQTPPDGVIGQTEGTIFAYVNFVGVTEAITNQIFFVREQGSNNGYIFAGFYQGKLNCGLKVGGTSLFDTFFSGVLTKGRYKIAIAYKSGDTKIYVNGVQTGFQNNSFGVTNFAQVFLTGSAGTNQLGDINREFKLYNTRLSDSELEALTTL